MIVVRCPVPGAYLVRDERQPVPSGKSETDVSIVVHQYRFGWVCGACQPVIGTTRPECWHIQAAQAATANRGDYD